MVIYIGNYGVCSDSISLKYIKFIANQETTHYDVFSVNSKCNSKGAGSDVIGFIHNKDVLMEHIKSALEKGEKIIDLRKFMIDLD